MAEAIKRMPGRGEDFDSILKHVYANFVVAQVKGDVARVFPGKCLMCKMEQVPYRITANCATPAGLPTGTLTWHCVLQDRDIAFAGERDIIVGRMIALWELK